MRKFIYILVVCSSFLVGCQAQKAPIDTESQESKVAQTTTKSLDKAPNVIFNNAAGERVFLDEYFGKKIYINVWSTKCGPCKDEIPIIEKVYQEYKDNPDYAILSVTSPSDRSFDNQGGDTELADILSFAEEKGITYPILYDYQDNFSKSYYIRAIPTHIFINSKGELVGQYVGGISEDILRQQLDNLQ